ncbi:MAG: YfhO family protein [Hominimerdicola sp.]
MFTKTNYLKSPAKKSKEKYLLLFAVAFLGMMVSFIPSLIANNGIFLYYGDFNSQQVMFYQHAHDMIREGNMGWDWGTDLGSSFVTSYSFYLLGSPFFWLTVLFPSGAVPYLLPWLLALKTAVAAVTAYAYMRYFVKNKDACFIGGLLYAFSGFQTYNVFFNHFHDATAFFPLLLLGFEMLVRENKRGPFAIACALCACVSYFFFISECVFLVIYFFIRSSDKDFDIDMKKFGLLILEAVLGVMISAAIFLPSVLSILNNYRVSERLYGLDLLFYNDKFRIARIFQAFFMLSDMPARVNLLNSDSARWASLAGYLPLFSMTGVIAFMRTRKKHWLSRAVVVFMIMACVPILNSAFVMFNASYYARWFYMPILLMCLMTAQVLSENKEDLKKGYVPCTVVSLLFLGIGLLPTYENGRVFYGKIAEYIELYYVQLIVTLLMIIMLGILIYVVAKKKVKFMKVASVMTVFAVVICMTSSVIYGVTQGTNNGDYIERAINGSENIDMEKLESQSSYVNPDNNFYRIDTSENVDNWCMFWGLFSMRCFHSVVSTSIMEFYSEIGQTRDVASRMETNLYPLRGLFSVKYYFDEIPSEQRDRKEPLETPETITSLGGFKYVDTQNGFNIYENEYYIPMGFTYDYYLTDYQVDNVPEIEKTHLLMKGVVLNDEQINRYSSVLDKYSGGNFDYTEMDYAETCKEKRENSCSSFSYTTDGFDAEITLDQPKLVFFSVPYDKGWSAEINGQKVDVEKVSYGFMAVLCQTGKNQIKFTYETDGLFYGKLLTGAGTVLFVIYITVWHFNKKKKIVEKNVPENNNDNDEDDNTEKADAVSETDEREETLQNPPEQDEKQE